MISQTNKSIFDFFTDIDEFIVRDGEHLIMWYKTFQDGGKN